MIVLLDTSTSACRVIIWTDSSSYSYEWEAGKGMAKGILSSMEECFVKHGYAWSDIKALGVFEGPGSYTGLRIGITVANTIAQSESIPIVGTRGEDWQDRALALIKHGENQKIIVPFYGKSAHITKPRK